MMTRNVITIAREPRIVEVAIACESLQTYKMVGGSKMDRGCLVFLQRFFFRDLRLNAGELSAPYAAGI